MIAVISPFPKTELIVVIILFFGEDSYLIYNDKFRICGKAIYAAAQWGMKVTSGDVFP